MTQTFLPGNAIATAPSNTALAVADLNGDGTLDAIVGDAAGAPAGFQVFLGGTGGFTPGINVQYHLPVSALATGDLNRDGKLDVVAATEAASGLSGALNISFGDGSGGFSSFTQLATLGSATNAVAVADLGGGGIPDLISSQTVNGAGLLEVFAGNGSGGFSSPSFYALSGAPAALAVADVNGDGHPDALAALAGGGVDVLLGTATGGFGAAAFIAPSAGGRAIAVADVNGDGKPDFIVGLQNGAVEVYFGNGSGGFGAFGAATTYTAPGIQAVQSLAVADINGDGKPDIVFSDGASVWVRYNTGAGNFGAATAYPAASPGPLAVGDVNRDGLPDVLVANASAAGGLTTLLGANVTNVTQVTASAPLNPVGTGQAVAFTVAAGTPLAATPGPGGATPTLSLSNGATAAYTGTDSQGRLLFSLAVAAGTDTPDLVVTGLATNGATVSTPASTGFAAPIGYQTGPAGLAIATADLTGTGIEDAVLAENSGQLVVLLGNGSGALAASGTYATFDQPRFVTTADLRQDGRLDLIETDTAGRAEVFLSNGSGGFGPAATYGAFSSATVATVADVNGDGIPDLVIGLAGGGIAVDLGNGTGGFNGFGATYAFGVAATALASADLNGDGKADLIAATAAGSVVVLLAGSSGGFTTASTVTTGLAPVALATADLNRDGKADLIVTNAGTGGVDVLLGHGDGTFAAPVAVFAGDTITAVAVADVNGDGVPDLVATDGNGDAVLAALGDGSGGFAPPLTFAAGTGPLGALAVADMNADGRPDVLATGGGGVEDFLNLSTPALALAAASVPGAPGANTGIAVSTTAPTVSAVTPGVPPGTYGAGATITLDVRFSGAVAVSGGDPTLSLNDGGTARYVSGSGTETLVFAEAVPFGEAAASLAVTGFNANGATLASPSGTAASLAAAVGPVAGVAVASPLGVTAVAASPASGTLHTGNTATFALTATVPVTPGSGGQPAQLALNDGGLATFTGQDPTGQTLYFNYTVQPGDHTPNLAVTGLAAAGAGFATSGTLAFQAAPPATGTAPAEAVAVDVNGDGRPDLVTADGFGGAQVALGNGSGGFGAAATYGFGADVAAVATAQLTASGQTDLVLADGGGGVQVLLNTGSGGFGPAATFDAGSNPVGLATADLNRDGAADLLVSDATGGLDVLLGDGSGGFAFAGHVATAGQAHSVATADLNGDGSLDLVLADGLGEVVTALGDGSGGFAPAATLAIGAPAAAVATADLNGDGTPDIVAATTAGTAVVLLGIGNGGFGPAATYAVGGTLAGLAVADINGDGVPDVVLLAGTRVVVLPGTGGGVFGAPVTLAAGSAAAALAVADLNGDGKPDIVAAGPAGAVLLNTSHPAGALNLASAAAAPGAATGLVVALAAPVASSVALTVAENAPAAPIGLAAPTDASYPSGPLTVTLGALPTDGAVTLAGVAVATGQALTAGQLTSLAFTPTPGVFGVTSALTYAVRDPAGSAATGTATLGIGPAVGSPVVVPRTLLVAENATATAIGIVSPTDPNYPSASLAVILGALPTDGTVTLAGVAVATGQALTAAQLASLAFTPTPGGFSQTSALTYAVQDPAGHAATGTATLAIGPAAGSPAVVPSALQVAENAPATAIGIGAPTDPNYAANLLAVTLGLLPTDGVVTLNGVAVSSGQALTAAQLASLAFTPTPGAFGQTSALTYAVRDPAGNAAAGTATLAIGTAVGNPTAPSPTLLVAENASAASIGIAAPTDPNYPSGSLSVTLGALPTDGTVTLNGAAAAAGQALTVAQLASLAFTPTPGAFSQTSALTYAVRDPAGNAAAGTATLAVGPALGGPAVASPALLVAENAPATAIGIAAPTDPNYPSGSLAVTLGALPTDGTLTLNGVAAAAGQALTAGQLASLAFTPTPGVFGQTSSLTYAVRDPAGNASVGVASLGIGPAVGAPVAASPTLLVAENAPATAIGIAAPTDPNYPSGSLAVTLGALPTDGTVTLNGVAVSRGQALATAQLASLAFTPTPGAFGRASALTYAVQDPAGNAATGTVTLAIGPAVGNPVLASPTLLVVENAPATPIGIAAPTDPNYPSGNLAVTLGALPTDGTVTLNGAAVTTGQALTAGQLISLDFTPTSGAFGQTSALTYAVQDPAGNAATGTATLAIGTAVPKIPTLAETGSTGSGTSLTQTFAGVADPGAAVTLSSNGARVGGASADPATGAYHLTVSLGTGLQTLTATAFYGGVASRPSLPIALFELGSQTSSGDVGANVLPNNGVVASTASSLDLSQLIAAGATLQFISGIEAVQLTDGTLNVGADTDAAFVQRLYVGLLGYHGDGGGLAFWVGRLQAGSSPAEVAAAFLQAGGAAGQTDAQFVAGLFQSLLGRAPDAAGLAFWTSPGPLAGGRGAVAAAIAQTDEAKAHAATATRGFYVPDPAGTLVQELYGAGLGYEVDLGGLGFWKGVLAASGPLQLAGAIAGTADFQALHAGQSDAAYVGSLFQSGLGRAIDPGASQYYLGGLQSGALTRTDVLFAVATAPEAAGHLTGAP